MDQRIELPAYSMFAKTPIYEANTEDGKVVVFGLLQDAIVPDSTDTVYRVPIGAVGRLDLLSTNFYGVPDLWWVLARVNNMLDPLIGVPVGTEIRIPAKSRLASQGLLGL